ncbi:MAG: AAA family ATPase, partial [Trueperaceae bacterium]
MQESARSRLAAYLPQDRRRALVAGRELPDRQHGGAVFADLSGFTALTERFSSLLGPLRGAEEMGVWLRRIYEALIFRVEEEGGSVLGFSGDAIACFYDGDDGSAAIRSARRMQDDVAVLREVHAGDGQRLGVGLKVAIAVGPVRRFVAGDPDRRLFDVLAGTTMLRLATHEGQATPGEILVDPNVARTLGLEAVDVRDDVVVVRPPRPDAEDGPDDEEAPASATASVAAPSERAAREAMEALPVTRPDEDGAPDPEVSSRWAPEAVRDASDQGTASLGDFRPAGAMFLSFGGIDWDDDPEAGARLDRFLRHVQRELARFGGTLIQVTVGDKGSYLYAAFGAPKAQGDDAERAVACALALVASTGPEVGSVDGLRAGVAYGAMFTGRYGSLSRSTYGVLGPKTNLAARLMKRAGVGEVMCDAEAARRARRRIAFVSLPPEPMKGVAAPVQLQRAERELAPDERVAGPMFGRDAERMEIGSVLTRLMHGDGGVVRYQGEAGSGKTRLLQWTAEAAEERGIRTLHLGPAPEEGGAALGRWLAPARVLLGVSAGTRGDAAWRAVMEHGADAPQRDDGGAARYDDPDVAAFADGALRSITEAARARPLLLLLDDLHRSDRASLLLLGRVAGLIDALPVGLVAVGRPADAELEAVLDGALPGGPRRLEGLEPEASRMVIAQVLGVPALTVPYPVATAVHERAAGIPALVEEIARDLVDRGALRAQAAWEGVGRGGRGKGLKQGAPRVTFDEEALRDLDGNLDALLVARLDRLTAAERTAMKAAAVIGVTAEHQPLAHLLESDPVAMEAALTPLEGPEMLEALPEAHRFRQQVLQGVAYETLLFEQRRALHRRMAAWYAEREKAGMETDLQRMALHFFAAAEGEDDPETVQPAIDVLSRLADRHKAEGELEEAIQAWERIGRLVPRGEAWTDARLRVQLVTAGLQAWGGDLVAADATYARALQAASEAEAGALIVAALLGRANLWLEQGAWTEAEGALVRAGRAVEGTDRPVLIVGERIAASRLAAATGRTDEASDLARGAVLASRLDHDQRALAVAAWANVAALRFVEGRPSDPTERVESAIKTARAADRPDLEVETLLVASAWALHQGDLQAAEDGLRRAEARAD